LVKIQLGLHNMTTELHDDYCEYGDCQNIGTIFDEDLSAWLCAEHQDTPDNWTGYCSRDCQLGHGCDGSC
jgi:hypothetical protein